MSKLLINESPMQVQPQLAVLIGLNEAIFAQQLKYLLNSSKNVRDGEKWIYNTYSDWVKIFPFWSESTIKRVVKKLEDAELIITSTKYNRYKADKTKWYRLNEKTLLELEAKLVTGQNDQPTGQNDQSHVSKWHDAQVKMSSPRTGQNDPTYDQETTNRISQENKNKQKNPSNEKPKKPKPEIPKTHEQAKAVVKKISKEKFTADDLVALGVDEQIAKDWLIARKAPLTQTALIGVINQAQIAKLSIADAIQHAAENGWRGFRADWLHSSAPPNGNHPPRREKNISTYYDDNWTSPHWGVSS